MADDVSLAASGVVGEATLRVALRARGGMQIKVKTLTGREIELDIEPTDTIFGIKKRVEEKEGIPPEQQRLIYGGKQLGEKKDGATDTKTAIEHNIVAGCVLHLVLALRGG